MLDHDFDPDIETMIVRIGSLNRYCRTTTKAVLAEMGLADYEYETLHALMIRDTPGKASPSALAEATGTSNAGMTGRLDGLEKHGWIKRLPGKADRRRVDVEITRAGRQTWNDAMRRRGSAEAKLAGALSSRELATVNRLLKKMTLRMEGGATNPD